MSICRCYETKALFGRFQGMSSKSFKLTKINKKKRTWRMKLTFFLAIFIVLGLIFWFTKPAAPDLVPDNPAESESVKSLPDFDSPLDVIHIVNFRQFGTRSFEFDTVYNPSHADYPPSRPLHGLNRVNVYTRTSSGTPWILGGNYEGEALDFSGPVSICSHVLAIPANAEVGDQIGISADVDSYESIGEIVNLGVIEAWDGLSEVDENTDFSVYAGSYKAYNAAEWAIYARRWTVKGYVKSGAPILSGSSAHGVPSAAFFEVFSLGNDDEFVLEYIDHSGALKTADISLRPSSVSVEGGGTYPKATVNDVDLTGEDIAFGAFLSHIFKELEVDFSE